MANVYNASLDELVQRQRVLSCKFSNRNLFVFQLVDSILATYILRREANNIDLKNAQKMVLQTSQDKESFVMFVQKLGDSHPMLGAECKLYVATMSNFFTASALSRRAIWEKVSAKEPPLRDLFEGFLGVFYMYPSLVATAVSPTLSHYSLRRDALRQLGEVWDFVLGGQAITHVQSGESGTVLSRELLQQHQETQGLGGTEANPHLGPGLGEAVAYNHRGIGVNLYTKAKNRISNLPASAADTPQDRLSVTSVPSSNESEFSDWTTKTEAQYSGPKPVAPPEKSAVGNGSSHGGVLMVDV